MRIGTWNLERPKQKSYAKNAGRIAQLEKVNADVWILTETNTAITLPDFHACSSPAEAGYHASGENYTTILSRWPIKQQIPTWDALLTVCVEIEAAAGPVIVYGTIITYANDKGQSKTSKRWQEHRNSIRRHHQEWLGLRQRFPNHRFIVAGDFNQSRDGSGWYEDAQSVTALSEALKEAQLRCITEADFRESFRLSRATIDHFCVGGLLDVPTSTIGAWEGTIGGQRLSDHNGVYADIAI